MKRVAIFFGVLAALVLIDGLYMELAHYHPDDQNTLFGNQTFILSDGQVTLISGGFLLLAAVIMWVIAVRRGRRPEVSASDRDQPGGRTASRT